MLMVHPENTSCAINYLCVCNPLTGFSFVIDLGKDFFFFFSSGDLNGFQVKPAFVNILSRERRL